MNSREPYWLTKGEVFLNAFQPIAVLTESARVSVGKGALVSVKTGHSCTYSSGAKTKQVIRMLLPPLGRKEKYNSKSDVKWTRIVELKSARQTSSLGKDWILFRLGAVSQLLFRFRFLFVVAGIKIANVDNLDGAGIGECGHQLKGSAHGFDIAANSAQIGIGAPFKFG